MKFTLDTNDMVSLFNKESVIELKFDLEFKIFTTSRGEYEMKIPFYLNPKNPKILIKKINFSTGRLENAPINFETFLDNTFLKLKKGQVDEVREMYGHTKASSEGWDDSWHGWKKDEEEAQEQEEIKAGLKEWVDNNAANILSTFLLDKDKINNLIEESINRLKII